jgi:hypothetical protein
VEHASAFAHSGLRVKHRSLGIEPDGQHNQWIQRQSQDQADQRNDKSLDAAESPALKPQDEQDVGGSQQHAPEDGNSEKQLEGDGRAEYLRQVAGYDGDFRENPKSDGHRAGILLAAGLGQIRSSGHAQLHAQRLKKHGHQAAEHDDRKKGVAELRAAGHVGGPIARIHIADGNQVTGSGKRQQAAEESCPDGHTDGAECLRE